LAWAKPVSFSGESINTESNSGNNCVCVWKVVTFDETYETKQIQRNI
jgi:hypothetical protein